MNDAYAAVAQAGASVGVMVVKAGAKKTQKLTPFKVVFLKGTMQIVDTACLICVGTAVPVEVLPANVAYQGEPEPAQRRVSKNAGAGKLQGPAAVQQQRLQGHRRCHGHLRDKSQTDLSV